MAKEKFDPEKPGAPKVGYPPIFVLSLNGGGNIFLTVFEIFISENQAVKKPGNFFFKITVKSVGNKGLRLSVNTPSFSNQSRFKTALLQPTLLLTPER